MKILITGANGQLGWELRKILSESNDLILTDKILNAELIINNAELVDMDITDVEKVHEVIKSEKPDFVVHCAAYTNVDGAEDNKELAFEINRDGSRNIAGACKENGAKLIAISTDYVFDGESKKPYTEDDIPNPKSVYGESKLAGEIQTMLECPEAVILRTAWLYGGIAISKLKTQNSKLNIKNYPEPENGVFKNFPNTMLWLAIQGKELKVVDDQFGCPTYAGDLAQVIKKIIEKNGIEPGIYHAVSSGSTNWFEFAKLIISNFKFQISNFDVAPVTSADFPTKAKRPKNSVLSTEKLKKTGIELPSWEEGLDKYLDRKSNT